MSNLPEFNGNDHLTMGVELELQLVNLHHFNLAMEAQDFLRRLGEVAHSGEVKPEITQAMIEINSSVHQSYASLITELHSLKNIIVTEARRSYIGVTGGGTHPFQKWKEQRIYMTERFANISEQYGYLAKQFTIFGQHIHVAVPNGDDALYVCHAMARYIPHFIALSASSPFNQGVDTAFDCSRLGVIGAFPLSGTPPWLKTWDELNGYFSKVYNLGIAGSIKDFYWDIRPKPEFGTVEIRICDTPLTVEKAAQLAAYAQALIAWILDNRPKIDNTIYLPYLMNRFRAARFGLEGVIIDAEQQRQTPIYQDILSTCTAITAYAETLGSRSAIESISHSVYRRENDAAWLREKYSEMHSLNDVVRAQVELWSC